MGDLGAGRRSRRSAAHRSVLVGAANQKLRRSTACAFIRERRDLIQRR
jgi:hypothetical protein